MRSRESQWARTASGEDGSWRHHSSTKDWKWNCTCRSFPVRRFNFNFLTSKHLIQSVHRVPLVFFFCEPPFWRHERVFCSAPGGNIASNQQPELQNPILEVNLDLGREGDEEDEEGGLADKKREGRGKERTHERDGWTFEEALIADI